jgi:penicillin V acylase-like amidase (Ntn superfamily)
MKHIMHPTRDLTKALVAITTLAMANTALPCSRVLWNSGDGHVFVGRTQDWTEKANSAFRVYPRGIERTGAVAENPQKWTSKYGSLVLSAYDMGTHEGVNEKGLSGHALYLAVEAAFGERDPKIEAIGIMQWVQYFLDNYATIFRTVQDLTGSRYYFESTYAPNVVWIDMTKLDFSQGQPEKELQVEKQIFSLNGDVTDRIEKAQPFVFGMNKG